jgi:2-enoate reductase
MEAARTLALRGHDIVLYEKSNVLGGCLIPAGTPSFKKELHDLLDWYKSEIARIDIEVKRGHEVTAKFIEENEPDAVILANGAVPIVPSSQEVKEDSIATASEVLLGTKPTGKKVVVVGGGLVGCETALWLAQQGKDVTVVDMLGELMSGRVRVPKVTKEMLLDMLKFNRVKIMTGMKFSGFTNAAVRLTTLSGGEETMEYNTMVFSLGFRPDRRLYESLLGKVPELYLIGDAREARNIMGAVWDAYEVARGI